MEDSSALIPIPNPEPKDSWLTHLRRDNVVFLPKEKTFAAIEWEYSPPGLNSFSGRVGLRFKDRSQSTWHVNPDGTGINGSQCILPVHGHLPASPVDLRPEDVRSLLTRLEAVERALIIQSVMLR